MQSAKVKNVLQNRIQSKNTCTLLFCFLTAFILLTICTKSSFLYPFNDWVDSNCFFTVGKSILNGKVLYRDIYEQKGPWLYFLHAGAYLISHKTFFGVYLLELFAGTLFLYFAAKTLELYRVRGIYLVLPLLGAAIYASKSFCHGDSVEELVLPIFMICIYLSERSFCLQKTLHFKEWLIVGALAGVVFWMKFNLAGFFVGWALVPLYQTLRRNGILGALKAAGAVVLGVLLPTVPVLVYFGTARAFGDLWTAYFYNNLFLYGDASQSHTAGVSAFLQTLWTRIRIHILRNGFYAIPGAFGALWYTVTRKGHRAHLALTAVFTVLCVCTGAVCYSYYTLVFSVFSLFFCLALCRLWSRLPEEPTPKIITSAVVLSALIFSGTFAYCTSNNTYLTAYEKVDLPQYKFEKIICSIDDPTLLNYGFLDGGFYTVTGITPDSKYFCRLNIQLPEMYEAQETEIYAQKPDFVVTRSAPLTFGAYTCVATATQYFEGVDFTYYLYAADRILPELSTNGTLQTIDRFEVAEGE